MSGLELQGNIVSNVLNGNYLAEPELWEQLLLILLAALLLARIAERLQGRPWSTLAAVGFASVLWLAVAFLVFCFFNCMIPVVVPIFGVALPGWFLVLTDQNLFFVRERKKHTKLFRYLAPPEVAQEIDRRQLGELGLQGKTAIVTTLSCQLQNFVDVTKGKAPEAVIKMLHECVSLMMNCVYEHNGLVNRLSSSGVFAIWGAPLAMSDPLQCQLAARCALEMQERLSRLAEQWQKDGRMNSGETFVCWFGLSTGEASCGRIGSESHGEYAAVGKSVDLCLILEGLNKKYGTQCLMSEKTAQAVAQEFETRELDKLKVDELDSPQYIYELMSKKGELAGAMDEASVLYKQGLAAIEERNFAEAERIFLTILRLVPSDRPATIMLERSRDYLAKPPEPDWDGSNLVCNDY
jgi:adenylate cyclase